MAKTSRNLHFLITLLLGISTNSLISNLAHAQERATRHLLFLGAGGGPSGPTTQFDDDSKIAWQYFRGPRWNVDVYYDGDHPESQKMAKQAIDGSLRDFSNVEVFHLLDRIRKQVADGIIHKDDSFLIMINTHGSKKEEGEVTHSISLSGNNQSLSLDELKQVQNYLENEVGVHLAIIDLSCFSGNTLYLPHRKTCIISSTGPETPAYGGSVSFTRDLFNSLKDGRNLEEIFLEARRKGNDASLPEISTRSGLRVSNQISSLYLRTFPKGKQADLFGDYLNEQLQNAPNGCERDFREPAIASLLENVKTVAENSPEYFGTPWQRLISSGTNPTIKNLENAIAEYESNAQRALELLAQIHKIEKVTEDREFLKIHSSNPTLSVASWSELVELTPDKVQELKAINEREGRAPNSPDVLRLIEAERRRNELLKTNELFLALAQLRDQYSELGDKSYLLAKKVAQAEREVYSGLYQIYQKEAGTSNPCRDFQL